MAHSPYATTGQKAVHLGVRVFGALLCLFLVGPILVFVPLSFSEHALFHYPIHSYSMRWYQDLFNSPAWMLALFNSFVVAVGSTLLATTLGVMAAIGLWRATFRGKGLLVALLMTPMVAPSIIAGVSMYLAFAPFGLNNSYLGLILAHAVLAAPLVVITVMATLARFEANLLRAAASLGAGPLTTFRRIMLPLILPGVATGAVFAFALSFDDVVVALFIAGPGQRTLPLQMYHSTADLTTLTITAAATLMLVFAVMLMGAMELSRKRDHLAEER